MTASATPPDQYERGRRFRALHDRPQPFVMANPWDIGTARLLASAGFDALGTTSAGHAASVGVADGTLDLAATLTNVTAMCAATDLPVSADLEAGFGDDPTAVAATITAAASAGAVGGSIEDLRGRNGDLYDIGAARERIEAAADAARRLPFDFVLTARCEMFGIGQPDLAATIERLQTYQEAGAHVAYAPGLTTLDQIRSVVTSLDVPVNVVMGLGGPTFSVAELGAVGVRRISVGSALARAAFGAFLRAIDEITEQGTFGFAAEAVPYRRLVDLLSSPHTERSA